jgi:cyclophilin family peptidyl-prolyl cis-trans isomerase
VRRNPQNRAIQDKPDSHPAGLKEEKKGMNRTRTASLTAATVALGVAAALSTAGGAGAQATQSACRVSNNIEAIIDDSGSMSFSDAGLLRVRGMKLFLANNEPKTLGALEFGSQAVRLFQPAKIGTFQTQMGAILDQRIMADNASTDYNAAFALAKTENPTATSRIFLTDGGHTAGTYLNGHRGGPPTYVVAFGSVTTGVDGNRLRQIASDTGGKAYLSTDSSTLQPVFEEITAALNCQAVPKSYADTFTKVGQSKVHALTIPSGTRSVRFTLSWLNPNDAFDIGSLRITRKGKLVAKSSKAKKLKVTKRRGQSFVTVKVRGLKKGKLKFRVKAKKLAFPGAQVKLTTQATRSRKG